MFLILLQNIAEIISIIIAITLKIVSCGFSLHSNEIDKPKTTINANIKNNIIYTKTANGSTPPWLECLRRLIGKSQFLYQDSKKY